MHFHQHKPQESVHKPVTIDTFLVAMITHTDAYIFQYRNHKTNWSLSQTPQLILDSKVQQKTFVKFSLTSV